MERFVGDKLSQILTVLLISNNVDNDINLRLNAMKSVYKNMSVTSQYLTYHIVTETLEHIVLESGNDNDNEWKYFQLKRYAFSCLEKAAADFSDAFFQNYYSYLKKRLSLNLFALRQEKSFLDKICDTLWTNLSWIYESSVPETEPVPEIEKLDRYMNQCNKTEKFRMLKTLSIFIFETTRGLGLSIFKEFQSRDWGKELLTYTLLSNNKEWSVDQTSKFMREINSLNSFLEECNRSYRIEDVLEILITTQKTCEMDIGFIIRVVTLLHSNESLDLIFEDFCFLPNVLPQLELLQFKQKCDDQKIMYTDESEIKKLQYLLFYSDEVIDITLSKVNPGTPITELIDFFQTMRGRDMGRKEDFLLRLNPNGNIEDWKGELSLTLIETFIGQEFPAYKRKTTADIISDFDKTYFVPVNTDDNKKYTTYCQFNLARKNELREALDVGNRKLLLHKLLYDLNLALFKLMLKCKSSEATFEEIKRLIQCLDSENKIIQLINALEILIEYEINISQSCAIEVIINSTEINVQRNIHTFVIECWFPGTYEKSVDQLINQVVTMNREEDITFLKNRQGLTAEYNKVMNAYNSKSPFVEENGLINNWGLREIAQWSLFIRLASIKKRYNRCTNLPSLLMQAIVSINPTIMDNIDDEVSGFIINNITLHERIAVIKRAMELTSKAKLRDVQVLSVILLLNAREGKGRLAQINTGEGKTMIIAMVAALHAIMGYQVDIITSSKVLAVPQSEQFEEFYHSLLLAVSHNFDTTKAYVADVLYGTSNEFQGDILRDEFRKSGCRHGRRCDVAIVDEVDNMLVDGNCHIVLLSCEMPAMDHLETVLATIYAQVKAAAGSIIVNDGQAYFIERENVFGENGERQEQYIENHVPIEGTKRDFIMNSTESHIRNLIRDCDPKNLSSDFPEIKIPKHLRELICKTKLKKWIASAIMAKFHCTIKEEYILDENKVKIVDADNTGVVQHSMHWSNGLHQFIEIKHGTIVNPESLTSNFISNVGFFRRYRPKIYGLSGTLGCRRTKKLLAKTYDLDFIIVPPFKFKQHMEISSIIVNNRDDWYREIVKSSLRKLCNGRAVLIIMEYINETEAVEKTFADVFGYDKKKMKLYKTDNDSSVVKEPLASGQVIITTNIAGRGTDIKLTNDVNKNGGLHVCITFLPKNSRVEEQNVGRTSRTGNRGTSQFILCNSESDIAKLRENRYKQEEEALRNAEEEIEIVTAKDEIFQKFCQLTDVITGRNDFVKEIERQAVEERFAIWLEMHSHEITGDSRSDFFKSFESFREDILRDDKNGKLIKNPYMFVTIGNKYLNDKKYKSAISEYTSAIELDPYFAEHAHYNRGYAYIAEYGGNAVDNIYFINRAIDDFRTARKLIKEKEYSLHLMQHASEGEVFSKQICNKLNLYNIQKSAIDLAIGPDIEAIDRQIKEYKEAEKRPEMTSGDLEKISEAIENLEAQKSDVGVIQKAQSNERDINIEMIEIEKVLPENDQSHRYEIAEFKRNGAIGGFRISEIPPIDWASVIGLLLLGLGQVIAGAALMVFTLGGGASFGMGLITEGISDIVTAVKDGIINRDFSWARWAIEKAISLVISVACAGLKAMKDVAKTAYAGVKTAASFGNRVVTQAVKEGWKLVAKKVSLELGKGLAKQFVSTLADYGVSQTIIPLIQQRIIEMVQGPIEEALKINPLVKMMLELDQIRKNQHYENRIMAIGMELLKPGSSRDVFDLVGIAAKIANGIADNKIPGLSAARQVHAALEAVVELPTLTHQFINKLNQGISKEAKKDKLEEQSKNTEKTTNQQETTQEATRKQESAFEKNVKDDIDLNLLHEEDEQATLQKTRKDVKGMSKSFVNVISTTMVNSIQRKLINPIVQQGINYSIESVTCNMTRTLNEHVGTYKSYKRVIHRQNKGFSNAKTKEESITAEEKQKIKKVEALIDDVRAGGPSGLVHLGAASDAIDRPIQVYDENGKLKYVIGDTKRGVPAKIQYHEPESGKNIGHFTLLGNKEPIKTGTDGNMCLYNVLGAQTGRDPNELKHTSLQIMENNKRYMAKQVDDVNRLEIYSQLKLAFGGATYKGTCPDDAEKILRDSQGVKGFKFDNPGHPLQHAPARGTTDQKLEAISQHLERKIIVYDENGKVLYSKGDNYNGKPIELKYHKPLGDTSGEWFSSKDGNEPSCRVYDPNDKNLYNIISKQYNIINQEKNIIDRCTDHKMGLTANCNPDELMTAVTDKINQISIDKNTNCVENYSSGCTRTGFLSRADMNYVTHQVLSLDSVKEKMNDLNTKKKLTKTDSRKVVIIPVEELGTSRTIYAEEWVDGRPTGRIKPAKSIIILLQHHRGKERDPDHPVHVQTVYPTL